MIGLIGLGVVGGAALALSVWLALRLRAVEVRMPTAQLDQWLAVCRRVEELEFRQADLAERYTRYIKREGIERAREKSLEVRRNKEEAIVEAAKILGRIPNAPAPVHTEEQLDLPSSGRLSPKRLALYRRAFPSAGVTPVRSNGPEPGSVEEVES